MTPQQLIRQILDAVAEDDQAKAEDAIEKYANEYFVYGTKLISNTDEDVWTSVKVIYDSFLLENNKPQQ